MGFLFGSDLAVLSRWAAAIVLSIACPVLLADTIAVIGTGEVAGALGPRIVEAGHRVIYGSRSPSRDDVLQLIESTGSGTTAVRPREAAAEADIVLLAVPWNAVEDVVRDLGDLSGKIIVDPTNPRIDTADGLRDYAFDSSNAQRIQSMAPDAMVVKAFNTVSASAMAEPASAGGPISIPLVGDSVEAKAKVASLVRALGFDAVDVGPLRYARIIEGLHYLRYNAARFGTPFDYYFRPASE